MKLFGTDGVRGAFGSPPIDAATMTRLGRQLGLRLKKNHAEPWVVLGGDTRESTPELASWLIAGLESAAVPSRWLGVVPTPGVAYLTRTLGAACGIVLSASHNPWRDNGVKLIGPDGFKGSKLAESELEIAVAGDTTEPAGGRLPEPETGLVEDWMAHLLSGLGEAQALAGLRIAVDAANGAASPWASELFARAGADVAVFHHQPDGRNINVACGSTEEGEIARLTVGNDCLLGVSLDGDADRLIAADATGRILDGDAILYLWARALQQKGELHPEAIVVTEMSNLGLDLGLRQHGITVHRCAVGDRAVVEAMRAGKARLGGEQSGHLIHLDLTTTGDGLLSALHLARLLAQQPDLIENSDFVRFPQTLHNVAVSHKPPFESIAGLAELLDQTRRELGDEGRVLLRYSGTEALARVMIEGRDEARIEVLAQAIAQRIGEATADTSEG